MKLVEVFDGNKLHSTYNKDDLKHTHGEARCSFFGINEKGGDIAVPLDMDLLSKHIMLAGGIGTGKTNAFMQIISQLRNTMNNKDDMMIIFDTKGDFRNAFYKQGDIVISNDNKATGANGVDYWNIFNEIEADEHMEANIVEISKSLFSQRLEKTNQPFFPNAAKDLFGAILTHFIRNKDTMQGDNENLRAFLDKSPTADIREMLGKHDDMRAMVSYIADDRSPQTAGVMSELYQMAKEILLGNFKKKGTLSIRDLVRNKGGKVIFIEYDISIGSVLTPIYSLMFDLAIKEALCRKEGERGNVYFITDEFRLLPNLNHIDDAVNFGRSLGVKFMIGIQNIEQIYECYGEHRANSIVSGFLTSVAFRVNDTPTRQFIKDRYGQNRKKEIYSATVGGGALDSVRDAQVVEDWDINNLGIGEAIIGLPDKEPFKFQFKKYE